MFFLNRKLIEFPSFCSDRKGRGNKNSNESSDDEDSHQTGKNFIISFFH